MRQSMTGFGAAEREAGQYRVAVEARSVNGRFIKLSLRVPSWLRAREAELEQRVRAAVDRGSLTLNVMVEPRGGAAAPRVREEVVSAYREVFERLGVPLHMIPTLPGVIIDDASAAAPDDTTDATLWPIICDVTDAAVAALVAMRKREGEALVAAMLAICDEIKVRVASVRVRAPQVAQEYYARLRDRLVLLLAHGGVAIGGGAASGGPPGGGVLDPMVLAREVAVLADRSDVTEEVDRLSAHVAQVRELLATQAGEIGRRLEFLAQEMHREVNTIGSKSADLELSRHVVELKSAIERLREQSANLE